MTTLLSSGKTPWQPTRGLTPSAIWHHPGRPELKWSWWRFIRCLGIFRPAPSIKTVPESRLLRNTWWPTPRLCLRSAGISPRAAELRRVTPMSPSTWFPRRCCTSRGSSSWIFGFHGSSRSAAPADCVLTLMCTTCSTSATSWAWTPPTALCGRTSGRSWVGDW